MNRSLSDEEKSASLKGEPDPYSASFEHVLEDSQDESLKRSFTLDRMLGTAFQKARSDFMTTQITSFDSDVENDPEEEPPDLPVSEKPQMDLDYSNEHSENIDVVSINSLPSLSDSLSVNSVQKQSESEDPVTKDSISTKDKSIKPSIRTRMKIFEANVESCEKSDVNKESHEHSEKVVSEILLESPRELSGNDIFDSNISGNGSENEVEAAEESFNKSTQNHSSIITISSANEESIVLSPNENSVIVISDTSDDSNLQENCASIANSDVINQQPSPQIEYPTDLNPFGDDEEIDVEDRPTIAITPVSSNLNSVSLNPFGDTDEEDEEASNETGKSVAESKSLNPFDSEEDEEEVSSASSAPQPAKRKLKAPKISLTPFWDKEENCDDQQDQSMSR